MLSITTSTHRVEHVGLAELGLEVGGPSQHEAAHVGLVVGDEESDSCLRHLAHVVVPLLHTQTCETQRRLTSTTWGMEREIGLQGLFAISSTLFDGYQTGLGKTENGVCYGFFQGWFQRVRRMWLRFDPGFLETTMTFYISC
jgi:hypothetical protein